ncbi:MAG: hypothetical protein JW743_02205 [Deltaproteobacteria bacterium]|nr:hypothetical protein [Deltaproteobacteria bacterium]MBN2844656.1 hypothetical protein [Deltaproteobacteria bacterium]
MNQVDLSKYDREDKIITSFEMQEIVKNQKHLFKVKSKIPTLDKLIDGFVPGELIAVSGLTKNGKSLFSQTLTRNFHDQQVFSLWFSFELPPQQFLSCFDDLPLIYMPRILKAANLDWLENRIIESLQKYRTRIIFLDHLHYIVDMARTRNPSIEIGMVIRKLKLLAVRENLIIFLMCHTKKGNDGFGEIRDSSFVEQESDAAFMIKRFPDIGDNVACLQINQHRRTGVLQKKVWLEKQGHYLFETTDRNVDPDSNQHRPQRRYWDD